MTEFWFIRHGESESNAGLTSQFDQSTPLTEKGKLQAKYISEYIDEAPNLFVVSPYLRAEQTASPTLAKFPDKPVETWPIQEFSYLSYTLYHNTNSQQRRNISQTYFKRGDPDLILGEGGESFNQFLQRIQSTLNKLADAEQNKIILFGHGWFMRATLWLLYTQKNDRLQKKLFRREIRTNIPSSPITMKIFSWFDRTKTKKMFKFLIFSAAVRIPNGAILKYKVSKENGIRILGLDLSHLPTSLQKTRVAKLVG